MLGRLHHIAGILAFSMCVASVARAEDDNPIVLSWSVPPEGECPDATYILGEIRRYVGPARADRQPIRANVVIRRAGAGVWQMVMKTEQGPSHGERTFRDASCDAISDAAVVVLAWMIDPDAMAEQARPAAPTPPPAAPAESAPKAPPSPPPVQPRREIAPFVGVAVSGDAGTLPAAASGAELRAGVSFRSVRVAGYGSYWPTSSRRVAILSDATPVGGTFSLLVLGLAACIDAPIAARPDAAKIALCAGPELDVMRGRSFGVNVPGEGAKTWVSAVAGVEGNVPVTGPWRLAVRLAAVLPTHREHFALQGVGEVHQPAAVGGRAAVGLELVF